MPSWIGPWELAMGVPLWVIAPYIALIFFLLTLQKALSRCAPENRAMAPGLVWLELIPVFGWIWQFHVAAAIGRSLGFENRSRKIPGPDRPGQSLGGAFAALYLVATVLLVVVIVVAATGAGTTTYYDEGGYYSGGLALGVGLLFLLVMLLHFTGFVLWIVYWVKISAYSSRLKYPVQWMPMHAGPSMPPSPGAFCPDCGRYAPGERFCQQCGADRRPPQIP
jgi:hypothetical protein